MTALMERAGLEARAVIDCSHANSGKNHERQVEVARDVAKRIAAGDERLLGIMLESNLVAGRQDLVPGQPLRYGQSITDACMSWDQTEALLRELARAAEARRSRTGAG